jgi:hypothetical protein
MFRALRRLFRSEDNKPVLLSFVLQRDQCSRLLGEFGEKYLEDCKVLIIIWENEAGDTMIVSSDNVPDSQAAGMLLQAANKVSMDNGK